MKHVRLSVGKMNPYSLPAQLALSFVLLGVMIAAAAGLPALWLLNEQVGQQAHALAEQGRRTTQALYEAMRSDLTNLALLTAQRPTLHRMMSQGETGDLPAYLETLLQGANLDLLISCDLRGQPVARAGKVVEANLCARPGGEAFYVVDDRSGQPVVWMLSAQAVNANTTRLGSVIAGYTLDDDLLGSLSGQTGLEQTLVVDGKLAASSFDEPSASWEAAARAREAAVQGELQTSEFRFTFEGEPYLAVSFTLGEEGLEQYVALPAGELAEARNRLMGIMAADLFLVVAVGLLGGTLLARRISRPLADLHSAATKFRKGDLITPVRTSSRMPEVTTVASALEDARVALRHSLMDLRREKEWIEHLLEAIVEGIVTLDEQQRVTFFSRGAERITGWKPEQVLGLHCDEVFRTTGGSPLFSQIIPAPGREQKVTILRADNREAILAITGARLAPPEAGRARVALVLRDVSEAEAVHHLLGGFLANITHEFRTPLSAQAAAIELLLDQLPDLETEDLRQLLSSVHIGVLNLQTLIDNLLEGASIEAGRFRVQIRAADLKDVLQETVRVMEPLFEKYGQALEVHCPEAELLVDADPRRTGQVLVNLLSNAVKFNRTGGKVTLKVETAPGEVVVTVVDQGPGIPDEVLGDVFTRFAHYSQKNEKPQYGVGLGLSVVKAIVEAQGGQAGARNHPTGGAEFWFTVPLAGRMVSE